MTDISLKDRDYVTNKKRMTRSGSQTAALLLLFLKSSLLQTQWIMTKSVEHTFNTNAHNYTFYIADNQFKTPCDPPFPEIKRLYLKDFRFHRETAEIKNLCVFSFNHLHLV